MQVFFLAAQSWLLPELCQPPPQTPGERMSVCGQPGQPAAASLYNNCLTTSLSFDNNFHVDELIAGGDGDHRHFRNLSFSAAIFL
jgi:hypothetical protein